MSSKEQHLPKIAEFLESDRAEIQMAAAIVLGELGAKDPAVVKRLCRLALSGTEGLQLAAITALEHIGSIKALPTLLLAIGGSQAVAQGAARAIAALGEDALPAVREKMRDANTVLRSRLASVMAQVAGKKGLAALLEGSLQQDLDSALKNAVVFRHEVKGATPKERKGFLPQLEKFLATAPARASEPATCAALRILGYLEDADAVDTLLKYVGPKNRAPVRSEALIALRFALSRNRDAPEVVKTLLPLLLDDDPKVARTALDTLGNLELPKTAVPTLVKVALGEDAELAKTAIARLGAMGADAAEALIEVALEAQPIRAQVALALMGDSDEARSSLLTAFVGAKKESDAEKMAIFLRPYARRMGESEREILAKTARSRLHKEQPGADAVLALLLEADPERFAKVLRAEAESATEGRKAQAARALYTQLCRSEHATDDDRFALARLELLQSALDLSPHSRSRDPALKLMAELARGGDSVADRLLGDRAMNDERMLYVGFHLAELPEGEGKEEGHAILVEVARGKGKLSTQAKNKLRTTGYEE
jgi:HEAT repeat protein